MSHDLKEAWEREFDDFCFYYKKVELTGRCMKKTGGIHGDRLYYEVKGLFWNRWVSKEKITFTDPEITTICDCACLENK